MNVARALPDVSPDLERYLERTSALELARRSLVGAPVYAVVSLIILFGTPILADYGLWAAAEASLLVLLGAVRVWFALGFEHRYEQSGEHAVLQFSILTSMQSLTFGVMAATVIWQYWATQEAVLTVVLSAGCIAAGTSALSVRRSAHFIFLVCVLAPLFIAVFWVGGPTKALLILGFLLLMALLVQDGGQARHRYLEHLKARFEADVGQRREAIESQARRDFLKDIGHEIRTPVTSIMGMTTLLQGDISGCRAGEYLEIIRRSCESLEQLVDSMPDAVRSRPDINGTQPGAVDLAACLGKVLALYRSHAYSRSIELITQTDHLPEAIRIADVNYLEQVLVNLIDNAVKHTRNGTVTLGACCRSRRGGELEIEVCVADTGCGIPAEQVQTLFEMFDRSGARVSGKFGGKGLGLPLCRGLVGLLGGEIRVESTVGEGTDVTFTMRAELDPSAAAWQPAPDMLADMPLRALDNFSRDYPHRILVVEDHRVNRRILCQFLATLGYQADEAEDGQMAVAAAMSGEYDMIFMDLRMPNMNGIEATRWIRQHGHGDRKPRIIALTGDAALETREQCFAAGMDDFITKPIRLERLEAVLRFETAQAA